jgi:hypothetical protein
MVLVAGSRAQFWMYYPESKPTQPPTSSSSSSAAATSSASTTSSSASASTAASAASTASASAPAPPLSAAIHGHAQRVLHAVTAHTRASQLQRAAHRFVAAAKRKRNPQLFALSPDQKATAHTNMQRYKHKQQVRAQSLQQWEAALRPLHQRLQNVLTQTQHTLQRVQSESLRERTHFESRWKDWNQRMTHTLLSQPIDLQLWRVLKDGQSFVPSAAAPLPPADTTDSSFTYQHVPSGVTHTTHPIKQLIRAYRSQQHNKALSVLNTRLAALDAQRTAAVQAQQTEVEHIHERIQHVRSQALQHMQQQQSAASASAAPSTLVADDSSSSSASPSNGHGLSVPGVPSPVSQPPGPNSTATKLVPTD